MHTEASCCVLTSSLKKYTFYNLLINNIFVSLCHLILGGTKGFLTMFVRKKKYPSGNIGVIVVEKIGGKMKELATIGVAYNEDEVENLVNEAKEWISKEESRRHTQLDLYGEEREACDREREDVRRVLSQVSNILLNGCDLINANIAELEAHGYKYIIGAKIKNESQEVKNWILELPKRDCQMVEYDKGGGRRLLVGYTDDRAKKDAYNREKGIRRLEKAYKHGALTKGNINKRGYNKFLSMDGEVKVAINYERIADDSKWDGLKGYLTNTDIPIQDVYTAYHNLWHVERAFRIAKSKIEIRPMFHFTRRRIEAHICICFVALKVYKELERMLKVSEIKMSVDKVLALAKTITTIQIKLPLNKEIYTQTMLMARHQKIAKLFDEDFWGTQ